MLNEATPRAIMGRIQTPWPFITMPMQRCFGAELGKIGKLRMLYLLFVYDMRMAFVSIDVFKMCII